MSSKHSTASKNEKTKLSEPPNKYCKINPVGFSEIFISSSKLVAIHSEKVWHPPTDIYETDKDIVIRSEIAGMKAEEISVRIDGSRMVISGGRNEQDSRTKRTYRQMEIEYGRFERVLEIHCGFEADKAEASYRDGFLEIVMPKSKKHAAEAEPKTFSVITIKHIIYKD